jgi:MFS family permease
VVLSTTEWQFYGIYALIGFSNSLNGIGTQTLTIEICPVKKRVRYFAIQNIVNVLGFFIASSFSGVITRCTDDFLILLIPALLLSLGALYFLLKIQEPRIFKEVLKTE